MTYEAYQIEAQQRRKDADDQQGEEWGFVLLELAALVEQWGYGKIARELEKLEPQADRDKRTDAANAYHAFSTAGDSLYSDF